MVDSRLPVVNTATFTVGDLLTRLNDDTNTKTTIIACCSRNRFFEELAACVATDIRPEMRSPELLSQTLNLLATSLNSNIVFCHSIPNFRAFIATMPFESDADGWTADKVIILNMLSIHHGTSEFTIQGLSRSFAMLTSVNLQMQCGIELIECKSSTDPADPYRGSRLWDIEVPLLSGSVKIAEVGQTWAKKTTSIRRFASRWFNFDGEL